MNDVPVMYEQVDRQLRHYGWAYRFTGYTDDSHDYARDGYAVIVFVNPTSREVRNMSLVNECENTANYYIMTTDEKSGLFDTKVPYLAFMDTVCGESNRMSMRIENVKNLMALEGL